MELRKEMWTAIMKVGETWRCTDVLSESEEGVNRMLVAIKRHGIPEWQFFPTKVQKCTLIVDLPQA